MAEPVARLAPSIPARDDAFLRRVLPIFVWVYRHYFRVEASGLQHLPAGPALLVSNHGGFIPWDGAMIHAAVWQHDGRHPRFLVDRWAFTVAGLGSFLRRTGNVSASPRLAAALLEAGELVGTFPEGIAGVAKPIWRRYRRERFGRGFVRTAFLAGVPIVPISVVGSEDSYPVIANWRWLGRKLGGEALPLTPFWPLLGPLGLLPLPAKWVIHFHPPVLPPPGAPALASDRDTVEQVVREVEATVTGGIAEGLRRRRGVFFGRRR